LISRRLKIFKSRHKSQKLPDFPLFYRLYRFATSHPPDFARIPAGFSGGQKQMQILRPLHRFKVYPKSDFSELSIRTCVRL